MKEPRRWLDSDSSSSVEVRRLLAVADKPSRMTAGDRARAWAKLEALEVRASIPLRHAGLLRFGRVFVPVLVILMIAALAAAAAPYVFDFLSNRSPQHIDTPAPVVKSVRPFGAAQPRHPNPVVPPHHETLAPGHSAAISQEPHAANVLPSKPTQEVRRRAVLDDERHGDELERVLPIASTSMPAPPELPRAASIAAELALIEEARGLVGTSPSVALTLLDRHAREFPAGPTSFSRELLYIEALRGAGRSSEARGRAQALLERVRGKSAEGKVQQLVDSLQ